MRRDGTTLVGTTSSRCKAVSLVSDYCEFVITLIEHFDLIDCGMRDVCEMRRKGKKKKIEGKRPH